MSYYADLTPCDDYFFDQDDAPRAPVLAVGWLDGTHPFSKGDPGRDVYKRLQEIQRSEWDIGACLGAHDCEVCRYDGTFGRKNLWIPGDGVTYCAPELILHYIAGHDYLPPLEFREAVMRCPPYAGDEYFTALRERGWRAELATKESPQAAAKNALFWAETSFMEAASIAWLAIDAVRSAYPDTRTANRLIAKRLPWTVTRSRNGMRRMRVRHPDSGIDVVFLNGVPAFRLGLTERDGPPRRITLRGARR